MAVLSLPKFAHATTAQMSHHVQNWAKIFSIKCVGKSKIIFSSNLNYDGKDVSEMGRKFFGSKLRRIVPYRQHDDVIKWKHLPHYWPFFAGNSPVTGEFPAQRPVTRSFDVFFDLRLNKRSSKQSWGWWFGTPSRPLWHHPNGFETIWTGRSLTCFWMILFLSFIRQASSGKDQ